MFNTFCFLYSEKKRMNGALGNSQSTSQASAMGKIQKYGERNRLKKTLRLYPHHEEGFLSAWIVGVCS